MNSMDEPNPQLQQLRSRRDSTEAAALGALFALDITIRLTRDWDEPDQWHIEDRNTGLAVEFGTLDDALKWLKKCCVTAELETGEEE